MTKRSRGTRLRRTWPQRLLITSNVIFIVAALVGAGSLAYAKRKVGEIDRILLDAETFDGTSGLASDDPRNFLIVGADSDDGLDANDPARAGRDDTVAGVRSDTIMIVRLDPKTKQAKVLSFPRDLWVDIPGNSSNRINASLQFGGADLLISTIKANYGIDINHYVQVDFAGFKSLVEQIDGVPVYFATPVRDTQSGLNVETAGCHRLDENSALDYVRSRHLKYYDEERGRWVSDPTSDLGRISRQQDFIKRVLTRAIAQGARNPVKLTDFVETGVSNIDLDEQTTPGDLVDLGQAFRNFDPATLETFSLPVADRYRGGAAVLDLVEGEAEPILAQFRGTGSGETTDGLTPALVAVQVLNGSGTQDQAADATELLATAGFKTDTPSSAAGVGQTEVRYAPGMEEQAVLVARHLFANVLLVPDMDVSQVTVVTGPDFVSSLLEPRPATDISVPTTTTTTAPTTTSTVVGDTSSSSTSPATTTTTAEVTGFVPEAAPPGVDCG